MTSHAQPKVSSAGYFERPVARPSHLGHHNRWSLGQASTAKIRRREICRHKLTMLSAVKCWCLRRVSEDQRERLGFMRKDTCRREYAVAFWLRITLEAAAKARSSSWTTKVLTATASSRNDSLPIVCRHHSSRESVTRCQAAVNEWLGRDGSSRA